MRDPDRIAFMTFSVLKASYGEPSVQEFDDRTPDTFAEAENSEGFIDRAKPVEDIAWMTNYQKDWGRWGPFAVPQFYPGGTSSCSSYQAQLRLKFQVQHPRPTGHRMLRWTDEASTSAARNVA
jgi:hypothetical protein